MSSSPPAVLQQNIRRLATAARNGQAQVGPGLVLVEYAQERPTGIYYLPEAEAYARLREAPVLLDLAGSAFDRYQPARQFIVLIYSVEGDDPLCWVLDYADAFLEDSDEGDAAGS